MGQVVVEGRAIWDASLIPKDLGTANGTYSRCVR